MTSKCCSMAWAGAVLLLAAGCVWAEDAVPSSSMPAPPQFIQDLNDANRTYFFSLKFNSSLTKGQIASAIQSWLQGMPQNVQSDYASWQSNMNQMKTDFVNKIKANLSSDGSALFDKIQGIVEDQNINSSDTCQQILQAINSSSQEAQSNLQSAVKGLVAGFAAHMSASGPGGEGMSMGGSISGSGQQPGQMGGSMGMANPCQQFMPGEGHGGPGGQMGSQMGGQMSQMGNQMSKMGSQMMSGQMPSMPQNGGQNPMSSMQNGQMPQMPGQGGQSPPFSQMGQNTRRRRRNIARRDIQGFSPPPIGSMNGLGGMPGQGGLQPLGTMGQNGMGQLGQMGGQMGGMPMGGQQLPNGGLPMQTLPVSQNSMGGQSGLSPFGQSGLGQPGQAPPLNQNGKK